MLTKLYGGKSGQHYQVYCDLIMYLLLMCFILQFILQFQSKFFFLEQGYIFFLILIRVVYLFFSLNRVVKGDFPKKYTFFYKNRLTQKFLMSTYFPEFSHIFRHKIVLLLKFKKFKAIIKTF